MVQQQRITSPSFPLMYDWSFDVHGQPVHISQARRGQTYVCPLCGGKMIARMGDVKRHHFAHDSLDLCTPANVARAVARRWLVLGLRHCLERRQMLTISWTCPICKRAHSTNLLEGVGQVRPGTPQDKADILLDETGGHPRAMICIGKPDPDILAAMVGQVPVIVVDIENLHTAGLTLETLLAGAAIHGGPCATQQAFAESGIVTDIDTLRRLLIEAANRPPYRYYGPLETYGDLSHVFRLGEHKLWLPPLLWRRAVGGLLHSIAPKLQIVSQEWKQPDGRVIALYYIDLHGTYAVAVRRFESDDQVYARLESAVFRSSRAVASDIARSFAES